MLAVAGQKAQQLAGQRRHLHPPQPGHGRLGRILARPVVVQQAHPETRGGGQVPGQLLRMPGLGQPLGQPAGGIETLQLGQHLRRAEKVVAEEVGQLLADAVLVAGDDGGVRDRQAEGVAEQRHHRKPVGHRTHHGGLRKRGHIAPGGVAWREPGGQRVERCGRHQQAQRQRLHARQRGAWA